MNRIRNIITKYEDYIFIFLLSFIPQLLIILFGYPYVLLWDENAYVATAKYFLGIGSYEESFRFPLLWLLLIPLIYLFGVNYLIIKIFLSLIFSLSSIFLYKLIKKITNNNFASYFFTMLYSLNGLILFWANKIYPDVLGSSLLIISIYYFYEFLKEKKTKHLILYSLFSVLSFLAKYPYGIFFISIFFLGDKKNIIKGILFTLIFLSPFLIYSTIKFGDPIYLIKEQFNVVYQTQVNASEKSIGEFFYRSLEYLGALLFFFIFIPKGDRFYTAIYSYGFISLIYFAFFVIFKDPRYLIQILVPSIIIFSYNIERFQSLSLLFYLILGISLYSSIHYSTINYILRYYFCYSNISSIYVSMELLKSLNAKSVISNAFWVWYGNYLNIESHSMYLSNVSYLVEKYNADYIVYSPQFNLGVEYYGLNNYKLLFKYRDLCDTEFYLYKTS